MAIQSKYEYYLKHANHNYKACEHFQRISDPKENFNDWIVTTAFYSSIYFVYAVSFKNGYKINGKEVFDFNSYYREVEHIYGGRHEATVDLTFETMGSICGSAISDLHNDSISARYIKYVVDDQSRKKCLLSLNVIKSHSK